MALEELLRPTDSRAEDQSASGDGAALGKGSLLQQVRAFGGLGDGEDLAAAEPETANDPVYCADGYERRSPVQAYVTPADFMRRRVRRIVVIVLGVCLVVLLAIALMKSGIIRFY